MPSDYGPDTLVTLATLSNVVIHSEAIILHHFRDYSYWRYMIKAQLRSLFLRLFLEGTESRSASAIHQDVFRQNTTREASLRCLGLSPKPRKLEGTSPNA